MVKRIIEENVVITTFDVDSATRKKSKKILKEHIKDLEKAYSDLSLNAQRSLFSIDRAMEQLSRDLSKLTYQNNLLTRRIERSLNRLARSQDISNRRIQQSSNRSRNSLIGLFKAVGTLEQAFYRLSAGFFVAGFSLSKFVENQRELYYLSQRLDIPVSEIEKYSYVVSQIGGDVDTARQSLIRFNRTLQDMALGKNAEALEVFGRLGINQFNKDGSVKSVSQAITEIKQKFQTIESTQTKVNYLRKLGFEENEFNYFIQNVSDIENRFESLYKTMTGMSSVEFLQITARDTAMLSNQIRTLNTVLGIVIKQIANRLLPILKTYINSIQNKIVVNNNNIVNTFSEVAEIILDVSSIFISFINMLIMFTGKIIDFWNQLGETEQRLARLGVAFGVFFKLFSTALLSTPFGRFITMLSMGLLLIEDYMYWKKSLENDAYKSEYDWGWIDSTIDKLSSFFKDIENPFENWNKDIYEIIDGIDAMTVAVMALLAVMGGKKIPKALATTITKHPALAGLAATLGTAGYLVYDHMENSGKGEGSTWDKLRSWIAHAPRKYIPGMKLDKKLYENTLEGQEARQQLYFKNPALYYDIAYADERFRDVTGMTREQAYQNYQKESKNMDTIGYNKYISDELQYLRKKQYSNKTDTPIHLLNKLVSPGVFDKYVSSSPEERYSNLGIDTAKNTIINNNITQTKGNLSITVNGNMDKQQIDTIKENYEDDNFFDIKNSFSSIMDGQNQLFRRR